MGNTTGIVKSWEPLIKDLDGVVRDQMASSFDIRWLIINQIVDTFGVNVRDQRGLTLWQSLKKLWEEKYKKNYEDYKLIDSNRFNYYQDLPGDKILNCEIEDYRLMKFLEKQGATCVEEVDASNKGKITGRVDYWGNLLDFDCAIKFTIETFGVDAQDVNGNSILLYLTERNNIDWMHYLLTQGANPNLQNNWSISPLMKCSSVKALDYLLIAGADVNLRSEGNSSAFLEFVGYTDETLALKVLDKKGSKVDFSINDGFTPLVAAAWHGHAKLVGRLLNEFGEYNDINIQSRYGLTPLMAASMWGREETVKEILKYGDKINFDLKSEEDKTALDYAAGAMCYGNSREDEIRERLVTAIKSAKRASAVIAEKITVSPVPALTFAPTPTVSASLMPPSKSLAISSPTMSTKLIGDTSNAFLDFSKTGNIAFTSIMAILLALIFMMCFKRHRPHHPRRDQDAVAPGLGR